MEFPALWFIGNDVDIAHELRQALVADASLGVLNTRELLDAEYDLDDTDNPDGPWPENYPRPVAALPDWPFAPDFWTFGRHEFASRRYRDALAQPGDVVQFLPFDLTGASAAARAQDYLWMRVLARQEALDLSRCECEIEERSNAVTGEPFRFLADIDFLALRDNLVPRAGIFRLDESPTYMLATDAVAGRVLRADCTGVEFRHPGNRWGGKRIERYRTADGIAERRIGFLR
jgi:hypothetical protein